MTVEELLAYHKPRNKEEIIEIYNVENFEKPIEILKSTDKSKYSNCNIDRFYNFFNRIHIEIYL